MRVTFYSVFTTSYGNVKIKFDISANYNIFANSKPEGLPLRFQSTASKRPRYQAQMAESVDALVSNTSGAIRAGSIPALGTL